MVNGFVIGVSLHRRDAQAPAAQRAEQLFQTVILTGLDRVVWKHKQARTRREAAWTQNVHSPWHSRSHGVVAER